MTVPEAVRDFCQNTEFYENGGQRLVGESPEFGFRVLVYGYTELDSVYPEVVVWGDDDLWYDEIFYNKDDFEEALERVFEDYLTPSVVEKVAGSAPVVDVWTPDEDDIAERESELDDATSEFLKVVYQIPYDGECLERIKDSLLTTLSEFDDDIYRPVLDGDSVISYPYSKFPKEISL